MKFRQTDAPPVAAAKASISAATAYLYRRAIMYGPTRNQAPFSAHIS
jgi:hypothetical protein